MRLLPALVLLSLCVVALSAPVSPLSLIQQYAVNYKPAEAELCVLVGENSGCSGCVLGTKGLCRWAQITGKPEATLTVAGPPATNPSSKNCGNSIGQLGLGTDATIGTYSIAIPSAPLYANKTFSAKPPVMVQTAVYTCLPAPWLDSAIAQQPNVFSDASFICPANAKAEPLLQQALYASTITIESGTATGPGGIALSAAQKFHTTTHHRKLINFPQDWPVDRTSRYASAGQLLFSPTAGSTFEQRDGSAGCYQARPLSPKYGTLDCAVLNNPMDTMASQPNVPGRDADIDVGPNIDMLLNLIPSNKEAVCLGDADPTGFYPSGSLPLLVGSPISGVPTWTERSKWCTRLYMNTYANTRCPAYGQAVSGICQSTFIAMFVNCGEATVWPAIRNDIFFPSELGQQCYGPKVAWPSPPLPFGPILGMRVVADDTPWCLAFNELEITGQFESLLGLHETVDKLNKVATTQCYGCGCEFVVDPKDNGGGTACGE